MARIRTIKPEFFRHEGLFEAERETGLPLRVAFAGLWTAADREGRFKWRPRQLKLDALPFDDVDFSRVLDALTTRGFIVRYAVDGDEYGCIPSWRTHQAINNREVASEIPSPNSTATESVTSTRAARVDHASTTPLDPAPVEGKGREGKRKGREEEQSSLRSDSPSPDDDGHASADVEKPEPYPADAPPDQQRRKAERLAQVTDDAIAAFNAVLGRPNGLLPAVSQKVGVEKRRNQVKRCLRTARQICEEQFGAPTISREFWESYWAECDADPFRSGRQTPGRGHENWTPTFEYLTREAVMLEVFDRASSEVAA